MWIEEETTPAENIAAVVPSVTYITLAVLRINALLTKTGFTGKTARSHQTFLEWEQSDKIRWQQFVQYTFTRIIQIYLVCWFSGINLYSLWRINILI